MIFCDLETTGLDPQRTAIASIGAVDDRDPSRTFYRICRLPDDAVVEPEAMAVNGFTVEQLKDAANPTIAEALTEFAVFITGSKERILANQNVSFDAGFLRAWGRKTGVRVSFGSRMVDLHSAYLTTLRSQGNPIPLNERGHSGISLNELAISVGLPKEPDPHNALTGAKYAAECFVRLTEHRSLLPEYEPYPLPSEMISQSLF